MTAGAGALLLASCTAAASGASAPTPSPTLERPPETLIEVSRNDCTTCDSTAAIDGLAVVAGEAGTDVWVRFVDPPELGDDLWLWLEEAPHLPVALERVGDAWNATVPAGAPTALGDLRVREVGAHLVVGVRGRDGREGVAAVSGAGERIPASGYAHGRGTTTVARSVAGGLASETEDRLAAVQSALPGLDDDQRGFALATLARQVVPGTTRYDMALLDRPGLRLVAEVTVRYPELAQHVYAEVDGELTLAQSVLVLADGTTVCTWMTDGSADCGAVDLPTPVTGLAGLIADPSSVSVEAVPAREVLGERVACWRVVRSTEEGPPEGETCALADGALAVNDNERARHRIVATERSPVVDDAAFLVPRQAEG